MFAADWQSIAALAVVVAVVILFALRVFRRRNSKTACGCGGKCPIPPQNPPKKTD